MANISQEWLNSLPILVPFTRDYGQRLHASELSRILHLPQKTVARKLELLQKLKILEYKRTGKNKYYFFNFNGLYSSAIFRIVEEYKEIRFLQHYPSVALLLNELASIGTIVVFGSYAKEREKEGSDLDMVIFGRKNVRIKSILSKYPFEVNAHYATFDLFEKRLQQGQPLAKEIAKDHVFFGEKEKIIKLLIDYYQ